MYDKIKGCKLIELQPFILELMYKLQITFSYGCRSGS